MQSPDPTADHITKTVGIVVSACVAAAGVLAKWGPSIREFFTFLGAVAKGLQQMPAMVESQQSIEKELKPNGGATLRDAIMRIEQSMATREARANAVWQALAQSLFEADPVGRINKCNRALAHLVQKNEDDLMNMGWLNLIPLPERYVVATEWKTCMAERRNFEMQINIHAARGLMKCQMRAEPILVGEELLGWSGSIAETSADRFDKLEEIIANKP